MSTALPVTDVTTAGVTPPAQVNGDVTGNILAFNDGKVWLEVISSDAGAQTVTVVTPGAVGGSYAIADLSVAVPAGATRLIGPFPPNIFNQADGTVTITPSVNTTLKFRAYHIP